MMGSSARAILRLDTRYDRRWCGFIGRERPEKFAVVIGSMRESEYVSYCVTDCIDHRIVMIGSCSSSGNGTRSAENRLPIADSRKYCKASLRGS